MIFLATFIGFITFVFRFFWMRKSMEAELELERRDKEHQEEINQMKMRFFINISHELRTPLTLILAPLQEIINKISDRWTRNQLEYIQRNANRLLHLVNQYMDQYQKDTSNLAAKAKAEQLAGVVNEYEIARPTEDTEKMLKISAFDKGTPHKVNEEEIEEI